MFNVEGVEQIDAQLLKAPLESLRRESRKRRAPVETLHNVYSSVKAAAASSQDGAGAVSLLTRLVSELEGQVAGHEAVSGAEQLHVSRLQSRADHLSDIRETSARSCIEWNQQRLPRLLVDYFLREGFFQSAEALSRASHSADLCDWHIFQGAQTIMRQLQAHSCDAALEWCEANAARLKSIKSRLLFSLHVQRFVELLKQGDQKAALAVAVQDLTPFADAHVAEFKRAFALIAFGTDTKLPRYRDLTAEDRWQELAAMFLDDLLKIHKLSAVPLLELQLQAGLTALKCPLSYEEGCTKEDPLHLPHVKELAETLPWAKHVTSKLVCSITFEIMDHTNPPMVLPNGYVYSKKALEVMLAEHGCIVCPVTKTRCSYSECVQAYIV